MLQQKIILASVEIFIILTLNKKISQNKYKNKKKNKKRIEKLIKAYNEKFNQTKNTKIIELE